MNLLKWLFKETESPTITIPFDSDQDKRWLAEQNQKKAQREHVESQLKLELEKPRCFVRVTSLDGETADSGVCEPYTSYGGGYSHLVTSRMRAISQAEGYTKQGFGANGVFIPVQQIKKAEVLEESK